MNKVKTFILDRLDERSTWRALIALITVLGVSLTPEQTEAVIAAGVAIGALVEALLPDPAGRIRNRVPEPPVQGVPEGEPGVAGDKTNSAIDDAFGVWGDHR